MFCNIILLSARVKVYRARQKRLLLTDFAMTVSEESLLKWFCIINAISSICEANFASCCCCKQTPIASYNLQLPGIPLEPARAVSSLRCPENSRFGAKTTRLIRKIDEKHENNWLLFSRLLWLIFRKSSLRAAAKHGETFKRLRRAINQSIGTASRFSQPSQPLITQIELCGLSYRGGTAFKKNVEQ